jgi:hypothetical protein
MLPHNIIIFHMLEMHENLKIFIFDVLENCCGLRKFSRKSIGYEEGSENSSFVLLYANILSKTSKLES